MKRYENLNGDSNVVAYELGENCILVQLKNGAIYRYTHETAGRRHVEQMKRRALRGHGLASYISQHVGKHYAAKLV